MPKIGLQLRSASALKQATRNLRTMLNLARLISLLALGGTIVPPVLLLAGRLSAASMNGWMFVSAVAWFVATPFWMDRRPASNGAADGGENP